MKVFFMKTFEHFSEKQSKKMFFFPKCQTSPECNQNPPETLEVSIASIMNLAGHSSVYKFALQD